ncbi:MAG: putative ABC transporter permease subunit, partial [Casimicrobiaceae bacterium]
IPTSFGGLILMMASIALIGTIIIVEARPVYRYAGANLLKIQPNVAELWIGFSLAALICLAATFIPIQVAIKRMKELER